MRHIVKRCLALVLCGILGSQVNLAALKAQEKTFQLVYKFETNQTVHYDVVYKMWITTKKGLVAETAVNESKSRKHFRVVSVDSEKNAVIEPFIDRVWMSARFGDNDPVVYDSESDSKPPKQFRSIHQTIGKPLARIKIAPHGEFLKAVPFRNVAGRFKSQPPSGLAADETHRSFLVVFPQNPIRVGDTWKDTLDVNVTLSPKLKRKVTLRRKYQLVSVENNQATISLVTSVLTPVRDPTVSAQLIQRSPEGTIVFDLKRGFIVSRNLTIDKTVIGALGDQSSMRAKSDLSERLVPPSEIARQSDTKFGPTNATK